MVELETVIKMRRDNIVVIFQMFAITSHNPTAGAPLERVQRVHLHPSIFRNPKLHPLIYHKRSGKKENWTAFNWISVIT